MNHSNKISPESRNFKFNFSKRGAGPLSSSSPLLPIVASGNLMMTNHNNNFNYGLSPTDSSGGGDTSRNLNHYNTTATSTTAGSGIPQNRVPEIQMINKFYGLIPKKFVICERIRPHTVSGSGGRQKSTARPKSTKESSLSLFQDKKLGRPSRQNSCSSESDNCEDIFGHNSANAMPAVTTRRISFEKLYRKKPKKLVHSKSVEQNCTTRDEPFLEDEIPVQRVIRIDLNQIKWDEESHLDDAKSCDGESIISPLTKKSTIRKTISFDENILERDELQNTFTKKMEPRPATAIATAMAGSLGISKISTVFPPKSEIESQPAVTTHWTAGKSTAERRAKLQRSFSIKEPSFDGGAESDSEFSKYPESLVNSGRKSLHVEGPPEVDTMVSKIRNRNQKVQQDLPTANFELELSRLIIESEAILANPGNNGGIRLVSTEIKKNVPVVISKSESVATLSSENTKPEVEIDKEFVPPKILEVETVAAVLAEIPVKKTEESTISPAVVTIPVENRLKAMTTIERRKLLKKSSSLPCEKELGRNSGNANGNGNGSRRTTPLLVRQSSLGGNSTSLTGNRAGVNNNGVKSNKTHHSQHQQTHGRISIKKPLVEITRLRPKTAPTVTVTANANPAFDRNSKRQPLKARSGVHGQVTGTTGTSTTTTGPSKPLPQTKGPDSPKKVLSWSSYSNMDNSNSTKAKSAKNNGNKISSPPINVGKDKKVVKSASEVVRHQEGHHQEDGPDEDDNESPPEPPPNNRPTLTRRSFSLDEGALLFYSNSEQLNDSSSTYTSAVEASLQDSKKREQCVKIYEKMMKVGCAVRLQTILRGLMTPSEYRKFITAAERAAATAAEEKAAAESLEAEGNLQLDAGVLEAKIETIK